MVSNLIPIKRLYPPKTEAKTSKEPKNKKNNNPEYSKRAKRKKRINCSLPEL